MFEINTVAILLKLIQLLYRHQTNEFYFFFLQMVLDLQMWIYNFLTITGGHCFYTSIRIYSGSNKLLFWCGKYQIKFGMVEIGIARGTK